MPYKSEQQRKCKWCNNPAKKWHDKTGRFKCYQKTCGSETCLNASYHDNAVNARKQWKKIKKCEKCNVEYLSLSRSQKWCKECVPTKSSRAIMSRYGISNNEYLSITSKNKEAKTF